MKLTGSNAHLNDAAIEPGIAKVVLTLNKLGYKTISSCEKRLYVTLAFRNTAARALFADLPEVVWFTRAVCYDYVDMVCDEALLMQDGKLRDGYYVVDSGTLYRYCPKPRCANLAGGRLNPDEVKLAIAGSHRFCSQVLKEEAPWCFLDLHFSGCLQKRLFTFLLKQRL